LARAAAILAPTTGAIATGTTTILATRTIATRATGTGKVTTLGSAAARSTGCGSCTFTGTARTSRTAEAAAIAARGSPAGTTATVASVIATRTIRAGFAFATLGRGRFVLSPLRAEAEPLKLGQIEFIEIRGRIFLGGVVVHVSKKSRVSGT
jgi:hypothetical protein